MKFLTKISCLFYLVVFTILSSAFGAESMISNPTKEILRWSLPTDEWNSIDEYIAKGSYLSLQLIDGDTWKEWRVYKDKSFKDLSPYIISFNKIILPNKETCSTNPAPLTSGIKKYLECGFYDCRVRNSDEPISLYEVKPVPRKWSLVDKNNGYKANCPMKLDFFTGKLRSSFDLLVRFKNVDFAKDIATVVINDEEMYIDLRDCKKSKGVCEIIEKQESNLEIDQEKLELVKFQRSNENLNDLIKYLLPCVKRRDESCIEKYFALKTDFADYVEDGDRENGFVDKLPVKVFSLNNEIIRELELCLDYKNLLPHMKGSRGLNKVCAFSLGLQLKNKPPKGNTKILSLVEPEGIRVDDNRIIYKKIDP